MRLLSKKKLNNNSYTYKIKIEIHNIPCILLKIRMKSSRWHNLLWFKVRQSHKNRMYIFVITSNKLNTITHVTIIGAKQDTHTWIVIKKIFSIKHLGTSWPAGKHIYYIVKDTYIKQSRKISHNTHNLYSYKIVYLDILTFRKQIALEIFFVKILRIKINENLL